MHRIAWHLLPLLLPISQIIAAPPPLPSTLPLATRRLIVGTKQAAPFSMKDEAGNWKGISIDIWRELARDLHIEYEFHETNLPGLISGIHDSSLDVAIAAISITPDREQQIDFTHPYFNSGLGIAVARANQPNWIETLKHLMAGGVLKGLALLLASIMLMGTVMWLLERRKNPQQFGGGWREGIGSGFWWSAVTLTTVGYGDKAPTTLFGRLIALAWMFSAIVIVSSFTATMTANLTIAQLESSVKGPDDLVNVRVGTVANATSEVYLKSHEVSYRTYPTPVDGLRDLARGQIDAMVYDAPILRYWCNEKYSTTLSVLPIMFEKQYYGIALPPGSVLRKPINHDLLGILQTQSYQEILERYLGEGF